LQAFQRSVESGDVRGLLDVLAPDVVLLGDGGGIKQAALRPVVGADRVARLLASARWRSPRCRCIRPRSTADRR